MKTCIIGTGRRAQRLQKRLPAYNIQNIDLIDSMQDKIDISSYERIIICIPTEYVKEVLEKIHRGTTKKQIISCCKGLLENGETVCTYLEKKYYQYSKGAIYFLGGANIDDGNEIIEITKDKKLELACILKNVYAIGFGMALAKGENYAAHELIKYIKECKNLGIKEEYLADLLVTCYSDKSRNKTFGKKFAQGEKYDEKTVEGVHTAKIIQQHNLFKSCIHLKKISKKIIQ